MLTLITGTPGAGKTLFALSLIQKETKPERDKKRRPIYLHNIRDVDYGYFHANSFDDPHKWYELPEGSLIVFDEGQEFFPQRRKDDKPDYVEKFATHRHRGYDIFIITQDPMNVDVFIRRMTGRHLHVNRTLGHERATIYEYKKYMSDPEDRFAKKDAVSKSSWSYDKKLYSRYKSAEVHTVKKRIPLRLLGLPVLVAVVLYLIFFAIDRIKNRPELVQGEKDPVADLRGPGQDIDTKSGKIVQTWDVISRENYIKLFQPVVPGLQHTAPIYDGLTEPQVFPKPNCIIYQPSKELSENHSCKCFTQQMTVYDTSEYNCRYWAKNGWFDFTRDEERDDTRERGGANAQLAPARTSNSPRAMASY